ERRWRGDHGARRAGARPAPEACDRWSAEGLRVRLRTDGQRALRANPVPGTPDGAARPRRRADTFDHLARRGAERTRAPRAAESERLLSRAAEAERFGAADAAPGPRAGSRAG